MQLILDVDNIDIQRNMSTIEQEPLGEKFLTDKVIDRLADDITTGNKENIQKQENIILDMVEDNAVETDKEIPSSRTPHLLTNNVSAEKLNDVIDTEDVQILDEIIDEKNIKNTSVHHLEEKPNALIIQNLNKDEAPSEQNQAKCEESNIEDVTETKENEIDLVILDENHKVVPESELKEQNESVQEILDKKDYANDTKTVKENYIMDVSNIAADVTGTELTEANERDLEILGKDHKAEIIATVKESDNMELSNIANVTEIELTEENDSNLVILDKDHVADNIGTVKASDIMEVSNIAGVSESELSEDNESDLVILDKDHKANITKTVKESNIMEISNIRDVKGKSEKDLIMLDKDSNADDNNALKEISTMEVSNDLIEEDVSELDKEIDISELSTELNEEKEMDLDKDMDIVEVSTKLNKDNNTEADEAVKEKEFEKGSIQKEVPLSSLHDKTGEAINSSEIEPFHNNVTNETNDAIEIDDEDEKISEQSAPSAQNIQYVQKNAEKNNEADLVKDVAKFSQEDSTIKNASEISPQPKRICRLSNNLDIFSDEEDDIPDTESLKDNIQPDTEKQCINIDDDDDIMLIDEDSVAKDGKKKDIGQEVLDTNSIKNNIQSEDNNQSKNEIIDSVESKPVTENIEETSVIENKETTAPGNEILDLPIIETNKTAVEKPEETEKSKKPLLPTNFINTCKKKISDMTRNDLEEFCILKIVESIVDRSNLGEIKAHLKNLTQTMEECKNKCLMLTKQNKDLQIVLKSVQEELKSGSDMHITPHKITRSVGMQVMMVPEKNNVRRKPTNGAGPQTPLATSNAKQVKSPQIANPRNQKEKVVQNQQIPVPRLVPATVPVAAAVKPNQIITNNTPTKQLSNTALPNGVRNSLPVQKVAEKRARSQAVVDLTDDEPPSKLQNVQRGPINQQMRVLTAAPNLVPAQRFSQNINSPRKVYIPISGPQAQNVRAGQTIMLKTLPGLGPRPRAQGQTLIAKPPPSPNAVRFGRGQPNRHPAPLPVVMKQCTPPNWKALPPPPDLKLSKVENGIILSWRIDSFDPTIHEEIASYQLYAYQETSSPPNTSLWKKIGDVKALALPMACTLTQFMAGYKYYFAVRTVDIRSRFGPFSSPGSILLLNKM